MSFEFARDHFTATNFNGTERRSTTRTLHVRYERNIRGLYESQPRDAGANIEDIRVVSCDRLLETVLRMLRRSDAQSARRWNIPRRRSLSRKRKNRHHRGHFRSRRSIIAIRSSLAPTRVPVPSKATAADLLAVAGALAAERNSSQVDNCRGRSFAAEEPARSARLYPRATARLLRAAARYLTAVSTSSPPLGRSVSLRPELV